MNNKVARIRRAKRARMHIRKLGRVRLCINRTPRHIYAQIISSDGGTVIASASTVEKSFRGVLKNGGNVEAAAAVGKLVAERAREVGVDNVAFDRGGFKFHGRVKALADAARENGLTI